MPADLRIARPVEYSAPNIDPGLEPLLTAEQVAQILGCRVKRVYELAIPSVRLSERALRWRPSQVAAWIAQREGKAA